MKYMVMECHTGYAVLLDEEGRFWKAADLHYEVGQTVENPVLMKQAAALRQTPYHPSDEQRHRRGRSLPVPVFSASAITRIISASIPPFTSPSIPRY